MCSRRRYSDGRGQNGKFHQYTTSIESAIRGATSPTVHTHHVLGPNPTSVTFILSMNTSEDYDTLVL